MHVRITITSSLRTLHRVAVHIAEAADLEVAQRYAREVATLLPVASLQHITQQLRAVSARTHTQWRSVSEPSRTGTRNRMHVDSGTNAFLLQSTRLIGGAFVEDESRERTFTQHLSTALL